MTRRKALVVYLGYREVMYFVADEEPPLEEVSHSRPLDQSKIIFSKVEKKLTAIDFDRPETIPVNLFLHDSFGDFLTEEKNLERLFQYIYASNPQLNARKNPVFIVEDPRTTAERKKKISKLLFEVFQIPAIAFTLQPILSLLAIGWTTGIVVEAYEHQMYVIPVYETYVVHTAIFKLEYGRKNVASFMRKLLKESTGKIFSSDRQKRAVEDVLQEHGYIALNPKSEVEIYDKGTLDLPIIPFESGEHIPLGKELFIAPEGLFRPLMAFGSEEPGIDEAIVKTINDCDVSIRSDLYDHIVLSGDILRVKGVRERLLQEIPKARPQNLRVQIAHSSKRKYGFWVGASLMVSLEAFQEMWIKIADYQNNPKIIFR